MQKVKWQKSFLTNIQYIIRFKDLPIPWVFTVSRSCKINCKLNMILVQIPIMDLFYVTNPVVFKLCPSVPPLFQENLFLLWPLILGLINSRQNRTVCSLQSCRPTRTRLVLKWFRLFRCLSLYKVWPSTSSRMLLCFYQNVAMYYSKDVRSKPSQRALC